VVERADQFDVPPAAALLERVALRAAYSVLTYAPPAAEAANAL
jgi:hypothetical protein